MKSQAHNKILNKKASMNIQCYLMLSVQLIGFMLITIYPIIWAIRLAWFSYDGVISNTRFVGWDNFVKIFTQDELQKYYLNRIEKINKEIKF